MRGSAISSPPLPDKYSPRYTVLSSFQSVAATIAASATVGQISCRFTHRLVCINYHYYEATAVFCSAFYYGYIAMILIYVDFISSIPYSCRRAPKQRCPL